LFSLFNKRTDIVSEVFDQMLFFFLLSPTMGLQWLMWIMPFLVLVLPQWYLLFIAATALYLGNVNVFWILQEKNIGFVR